MTTRSHFIPARTRSRTGAAERLVHRGSRLGLVAAVSVLTVVGLGAGPGQAVAQSPTQEAAVSAHHGPATDSGSRAQQRDRLAQLARKVVAAGAPGVMVRVDDGRGKPVEVAEQAPWARSEHRLRLSDEFRMGSNTKTMMATLVLQLTAEGKLALTDPVDKWLPGQVPGGHAITLRMLLNHTSGLADYTEDPALLPSILGKDQRRWTSERLLAVGVRHDPLFAPGAKWSYSNTNYAAVGAVLENATGNSLAELVRDRIARPLGLKHTYYAEDSTWRGPHARGYEPDATHMPPGVPTEFRDYAGVPRAGHVDVSANSPSWGGAAGAVVSTARDWDRFSTALMSGRLLPAAQLAQLRTTVPIFPDRPKGPGYGLGIETLTTECGTVWSHDGGIPGYLSTHLTDPTGKRTASVLISTEAFAEFPDAFPALATASRALQSATLCAMFGKPAPGAARTG
ncbi:class A beta-lactamase-related serine hydrolase [Streptomyces spectabilis]|uniref:Class A beta-lactamase-related serine hydrolase n=1 Tax=Streptomyces spectabilis TaxID=68270 RepID=A0A5P2WZS7_STRST|nr:class A beta-lactamase-related serine hydrolase [Streptomyces spectabilis]